MSGSNDFSLASAITLGATEQGFFEPTHLGDAVHGQSENGPIEELIENIWNAIIEGLKAGGNSMQRASQTAGSAMQSGGSSIIDTMNRMNLRMSQQAAMGA